MDDTPEDDNVFKEFKIRRSIGFSMIGLLIISFSFYWLAYRPEAIRSDCALDASKRAYYASAHASTTTTSERNMADNDDFEAYYFLCVRSKGIAN